MEVISEKHSLGCGESSVISICKTRGLDYALLADIDAIRRAKALGIKVLNPVDIGKMAYENSLEEYEKYLHKLSTSAEYNPRYIEKEIEKLRI